MLFDSKKEPDFSVFSSQSKKILLLAESIALFEQAPTDTLHTLLAILKNKESLAADILENFRITSDRLLAVAEKPTFENAPGYISSELKFALTKAHLEASLYESSNVESEHLLLGILADANMRAVKALRALRIPVEKITEQVDFILSQAKNSAYPGSQFENKFPGESEGLGVDRRDENFLFPEPLFRQQPRREKLVSFTRDLTALAKEGKLDPLIGREAELERVINILMRRNKNNPVLIGEAGVGKTAIVEGLAQRIENGRVPLSLRNMRLLELDLSQVVAGTIYRGQFEERLKNIIEELCQAKDIILFIDEIHTVIGAGSAEGSLDAAQILKPILAKGSVRVIGATTISEYKKIARKDRALLRRLQPVRILAPSKEATLQILKELAPRFSLFHKVKLTPEILKFIVELSDRYISDRAFPDKAIDLLDETCAYVRLKKELKSAQSPALFPKEELTYARTFEKELPLYKEGKLLVPYPYKVPQEILTSTSPVVEKKDVFKIISLWIGVPVSVLVSKEAANLNKIIQRIKKRIVGQDEAIEEIMRALSRYKIGISDPKRPIGAYLFIGPTGVGKTELAKVIAEEVFGPDNLIRIDLSEFMEKHQTARLLGAPPGYVGYDEGSLLFEELKKKPHSVILFDEIEKAHADFTHILLQIMEDGKLTDSQGNILNFNNTLIIFTSNLGGKKFLNLGTLGFTDKQEYNQSLERLKDLVESEVKEFFLPEFLSRLTKVILFKPLDNKAVSKIITLKLRELKERLYKNKIALSINPQVISFLRSKINYQTEGARHVRKIIEKEVEGVIAEALINNPSGKKIALSVNKKGEIGAEVKE